MEKKDLSNLTDEEFFLIANDYNHYEDYEEDYSEDCPADNTGFCSPTCFKCR